MEIQDETFIQDFHLLRDKNESLWYWLCVKLKIHTCNFDTQSAIMNNKTRGYLWVMYSRWPEHEVYCYKGMNVHVCMQIHV